MNGLKKILFSAGVFFSVYILAGFYAEAGNIVFSESSSLQVGQNSLEINVFPNPVQDKWFTIDLSDKNLKEIRISNIAGIQVYQRKFREPVKQFRMYAGDMPSGIYLLKISSEENLSKTVKLLINNKK